MDRQSLDDLFVASMTLAEIRRGILDMPPGARQGQLESWFAGPQGPRATFRGRILGFDEHAAEIWARLMAESRSAGLPRDAIDMIIAATAEAGGCIVATANERHFTGIEHVNPLR